MLFFMLYSEII